MNRVLSIFAGAVVLLAVVAALAVANRPTNVLDPHTPEGVVQEYLKAMIAGDYAVAAELLSPLSGCGVSDLAVAYAPGSARVTLDHSAIDGDHAVVSVDVTEGSEDGPFGSSGFSHTEGITLQREGGAWKITGSPWLLSSCGSTKG